MKLWKALAIALGAILVIGVPYLAVRSTSSHRGVRLLPPPAALEPRSFDPRQSAALFVGVRTFKRGDDTPEVQYAADDAVDMAYMFALDHRVALISPSRVVIALSGRPEKEVSRRRLEELQQAGARLEKGEQGDILKQLQSQAASVGKDGILIVSVASHGFMNDGVPYILGSNSEFQFPETAVPASKLFEIAATSEAPRSLFFIDACRERISKSVRGVASAATAAPLMSRMGRVHGQVVFCAAAAGGYAYDGDGNGVFTKAVLEGLNCNAALTRGEVTVDTLRTYVERYVRTWIRQHRNPAIGAATQVSMDGDSKNMPLSSCAGPPPPPPPGDVARATFEGSTVTALDANGAHLWSSDVGGRIARVEVPDLDADGSHEVVVALDMSIKVFDRAGTNLWSAGGSMKLRTFLIDHLLYHDRRLQITALWNDEHESRSDVSTYSSAGQCLSTYSHHGRLQQIVIDRPTTHHNRRIIAFGTDDEAGAHLGIRKPLTSVVMLGTKSKLLWEGVLLPPSARIARITVVDHDKYSRDITLTTASGSEIQLDFDGNVLANSSPEMTFKILPRKTRRAMMKRKSEE